MHCNGAQLLFLRPQRTNTAVLLIACGRSHAFRLIKTETQQV